MQAKLVVLFIAVLLAFAVLILRLFMINRNNGNEYKKQVLSQRSYDSREIPYKRGSITDRNGTVLATSELIYNVIVDAYQMNNGPQNEDGVSSYLNPTLDACERLGLDRSTIEQYIHDNPDSRYYIARKGLTYEEKTAYEKEISDAAEERTYKEMARPGRPRVLLVKEIMGQGAMHDNLILPEEPCGFIGGRPNVDLGNVPIFLRVNEVRDGGIHALTCITPDTKETSLVYWREPIVKLLAEDPELDFIGVLFVGSPQANAEKFYVSRRVGATVEGMNVQGAIVTTEGFGNNHIDFASHIEQIGSLGIPVVGVSYCGVQGALVVGNKYMDAMVDLCVSEDGNVEDILAKNSLSPEAALRAVAMMKTKMGGKKINPAPRKYNYNIIEENEHSAREIYKC